MPVPKGKKRRARPADTVRVGFTLNGAPVSVDVPSHERLLDTLRYRLGLTGTKEGCGEGECGACTVHLDGLPVNSCLVPTYQVRQAEVRSVEGVDSGGLGSLLRHGATQCGACTPGVVMTACWLRENTAALEHHSVRKLMAGNLCRCTGYDGIVDGITAVLAEGTGSR